MKEVEQVFQPWKSENTPDLDSTRGNNEFIWGTVDLDSKENLLTDNPPLAAQDVV